MSRTTKNVPGQWRQPRGQKQAIMRGCPKNKIPPSWWRDDPSFSCMTLAKIVYRLTDNGMSDEQCIQHLVHRYGCPRWMAAAAVRTYAKH